MIILKIFYSTLTFIAVSWCFNANAFDDLIANTDNKMSVIKKIKQRYAQSMTIEKMAMKFDETFNIATQSYDFRNPVPTIKTRFSELDFTNRFYTEDDKITWPGGFVFHLRDFQNAQHSYLYDVNGVVNGKRVKNLGLKSFDDIASRSNNIVDFLAVKNFLKPSNIIDYKMEIKSRNNQVVFTLKDLDDIKVYHFSMVDALLMSVQDKESTWHYSQRKMTKGIAFSSHVDRLRTVGTKREYDIEFIKPIVGVTKAKQRLPQGYDIFIPTKNKKNTALFSQQIANNIFLVTSELAERNILFKVSGNSISVFGAPLRDKFSNEVIDIIKQKFPMKKIDYVYVTHAHNDHIGGLQAYVNIGAKVLADAYTIDAIKHYKRFSNSIHKFEFKEIKPNELFKGIRFYLPKNSHSKGQSFAYFEAEKLIYEGDFLEIPFDNTIATYLSDVERQFIEFINKQEIDYNRIVGHHRNNNISPSVVKAYYLKNR